MVEVWNTMQQRRKEASRKLRQPLVTVLEDVIRDDLADLRSMVARDYAAILTGIGDSKEFHHLNKKNNVSLSDKDRRHFETMFLLTERVIWIALRRKYLSVIEKEINRLFRTDTFNPVEHHSGFKYSAYVATPEEQRILKGKACTSERKLLQRSPAIQEIIFENHDYKMLAIGVTDVGNSDARQRYLEAAYAAPEELLEDLEIGVGILGKPREFFDPLLKPLEISTTKKRGSVMKPIPEFVIPPRDYRDHKLHETLPRKPCKYWETKSSQEARKNQCKLWREYINLEGQIPSATDELMSPSFVTLRTSIAPVYSKYN